jgi:hypothetical protein
MSVQFLEMSFTDEREKEQFFEYIMEMYPELLVHVPKRLLMAFYGEFIKLYRGAGNGVACNT